MKARAPVPLPRRLAALLRGARWAKFRKGVSGDRLYLVRLGNDTSWVMKILDRRKFATHRVSDECQRLQWLAGRVPAPRPVWCGRSDAHEFLLMTRIPGTNCDKSDAKRHVVVQALAKALRMIHSLPIADCPFDATVGARLASIKGYIERGAIHKVFEDEEGKLWRPSVYLRYLSYTQPDGEDLVFTHGDFCHPNVLVKGGELTGVVDWTYAGVADRHQDLAWVGYLVEQRFGRRWLKRFLRAYGLAPLDRVKMQYYIALNEVYWSARQEAAGRIRGKLHG